MRAVPLRGGRAGGGGAGGGAAERVPLRDHHPHAPALLAPVLREPTRRTARAAIRAPLRARRFSSRAPAPALRASLAAIERHVLSTIFLCRSFTSKFAYSILEHARNAQIESPFA